MKSVRMLETRLALNTLLLSLACLFCASSFPALAVPDLLAQNNGQSPQSDRAAQLSQRGREQIQRSQFRAAIETYEQLAQLYRERGNSEGEGESLYFQGVARRYLSQYSEAIALFEQAAENAQASGNRRLWGRIQSEMGIVHYFKSEYPQALEFCQQALAVSREVEDRELEAQTLHYMGAIAYGRGDYDLALQLHQAALGISEEINHLFLQVRILNNIAIVEDSLGNYPEAIALNNKALLLSRERSYRFQEARILGSLGVTQGRLGEYSPALEFQQSALEIQREIGDRAGEGVTLNNIATVYDSQGDYQQALAFYQQALEISREIGDRASEGNALNNIGVARSNLGDYDRAAELYQQALEISREIGDRAGEGNALTRLGDANYNQGRYAKALVLYEQALGISREIGDRVSEGNALNSLGSTRHSLGEYAQALEFYEAALSIFTELGNRAGQAQLLGNLGLVRVQLQQRDRALAAYEQALEVQEEIGDRAGAADTLNNIGALHILRGEDEQAVATFERALAARQEIGDRAGEANTLGNLGVVYENLQDTPSALAAYQQALTIFQDIGDRVGERTALNNIGSVFEQQQQRELAILFYKQAVNVTEAIRQDLAELPASVRQSYTETVAQTYRHLADLLLQQNRVLEAQQVLDLLKVQELEDYLDRLRGNSQTAQGVANLPPERQLLESYDRLQQQAIALGQELTQLRQIPDTQWTPEQEQRIVELVSQQQKLSQNFADFTRQPDVVALVRQLSQTAREQSLSLSSLKNLADNLRDLDRNAVLLYPLILRDRIELILATPDAPPIRHTVSVPRAELNQTILDFRRALQTPTRDPKQPAQKLYNWLIAPLENDLKLAQTETIIYAPDGQLRYVPLAALHDGQGWLVERFEINNITAQSLTDFNQPPQEQLRVLAGAFASGKYEVRVGESIFAFSGLTYAGKEVEILAETVPNTTMLVDEAFSKAATTIRLDSYSIVHFATHGALVQGQPESSFILFGNGETVSLQEVRDRWQLTNVDLVVLSACQTGLGAQLGNGEEILGFGYIMQEVGARAAIASLWSVDDGGTQMLMNAFYRALQQPGIVKVEALRQAQLALIRDEEAGEGEERGIVAVRSRDENLEPEIADRLSHPYYWAPFILIGNGL